MLRLFEAAYIAYPCSSLPPSLDEPERLNVVARCGYCQYFSLSLSLCTLNFRIICCKQENHHSNFVLGTWK